MHKRLRNLPELAPSDGIASMVPVCRKFWLWTLQCSINKLYQPTLGKVPFAVDFRSRPFFTERVPVREHVVHWLRELASLYLQDPTRDLIQLPFASRQTVYELYASETQEYVRDCPKPLTTPAGPASLVYFRHIWAEDARVLVGKAVCKMRQVYGVPRSPARRQRR